jgi:predicted GIY-YIG superfamily endonuclease
VHYRDFGRGTVPLPSRPDLQEDVRHQIVSETPRDTYHDLDGLAPFQRDTSISTIVNTLLPFTTGTTDSYAVYVLECLQEPTGAGVVVNQGVSESSVKRYKGVGKTRRVVYVGVAKNLLQRIDQHLNHPGRRGANFTALYPPVRVLQVGWFPRKKIAERAEEVTAELLRDRFPEDFISYPG